MGMTKNHNVLDYCAPGDIDDDSQYTLAGDILEGGERRNSKGKKAVRFVCLRRRKRTTTTAWRQRWPRGGSWVRPSSSESGLNLWKVEERNDYDYSCLQDPHLAPAACS